MANAHLCLPDATHITCIRRSTSDLCDASIPIARASGRLLFDEYEHCEVLRYDLRSSRQAPIGDQCSSQYHRYGLNNYVPLMHMNLIARPFGQKLAKTYDCLHPGVLQITTTAECYVTYVDP